MSSDGHQGVGTHVERHGEAIAGRVHEGALQVFAAREGQRVDEDIELTVMFRPAPEDALDLGIILDVTGLDEVGVEAGGQGSDTLLQETLDGAEADRRAVGVECLSDTPADGVVIGHAEDERLAPVQKSHAPTSLAWWLATAPWTRSGHRSPWW